MHIDDLIGIHVTVFEPIGMFLPGVEKRSRVLELSMLEASNSKE